MSLAPWRSLIARALHRNRSDAHSRYLQLATVSPGGKPANRTIVFRDFLDSGNALAFVTDARSDKIDHIHHHPWGEACWYFTGSREQFRLAGPLQLVDANTNDESLNRARAAIWSRLSERARQQFVWPDPGAPKAQPAAFDISPPAADQPPQTYCLLTLDPLEVIHLELRGDPQNRTVYSLNASGWESASVNP